MTKVEAYILLGGMVLLTVFGQLLIKWQVTAAVVFPDALSDRLLFLGRILLNPWVILALTSAFLAGLCWIAAMTRIPLTIGYPFISLTLPLVLLGGTLFFSEELNWPKVVAIALIMAGMLVHARS